jgi:DNA polymerase V
MLADLPIGEPVPFCPGSLGEGLDLQSALIPNPVCTFYMRASGNGMRQHGINDGDLMVIDRSVEPCCGPCRRRCPPGQLLDAAAAASGGAVVT